MEHEILKYSEDFEHHIDQIARLKAINWDLDFDVFRSYVKWNYIDRPHSKPPIIYFVRIGEEIVAMRGVYETTWQVKSASAHFKALCGADLLILQEYRNKGIYKELADFVMDDLEKMGVQYIFSFNASPSNTIISLFTGWKKIGEIEIIKKQFQSFRSKAISHTKKLVGPYTRKIFRKTGINLILQRRRNDNSQRIDRSYQSQRTQLSSRISLENKPKPVEMALLISSILPENKITLVRDEMYFQWRYNNPLSKYLFLYWYDDGLKGYLVLQSHLYSTESEGSHNIFELEATNSTIKIELLNSLISLMNSGSLSIWANMLDQASYEFLVSQGFRDDRSAKSVKNLPQTILIRPLGEHNNKIEFQDLNLLDATNWDLQMIYLHDH